MEKKTVETNKTKVSSNLIDAWLKINVLIHNELEKLKSLDSEREEIGKNLSTLPEAELKKLMFASIKKYEQVLTNIQKLKTEAQKLSALLDKKK